MRVSEIRVTADDASCALRGRVESDRDPDDDDWFEPFTLWHRFPAWCEPYLSAENGDPFLAALLLPAMVQREPLAIPARVSPRLLRTLPVLQDVYASFQPGATRIAVEVAARAQPLPEDGSQASVGLFFSLGVDSFYSLLKNQRDHAGGERRVTHFIPVHGFDMPYDTWDDSFPPALLANFQRVAAETGTTLLPVVTNVRREGGLLASWPMLHGAAMASIVLALGSAFRRMLIAASTTYDKLYPWGSHPVLDPLWSTEAVAFVHDGCELNTIDKTRVVAESPLALATLRPCASGAYNCGVCLKCLRTMLDLTLCGQLEACQTLPHTIDPAALRAALRPGGPVHVADFTRRLHELRASGAAPEVVAVLEEHLAQGMARKWGTPTEPAAGATAKRSRFSRLSRRIGW